MSQQLPSDVVCNNNSESNNLTANHMEVVSLEPELGEKENAAENQVQASGDNFKSISQYFQNDKNTVIAKESSHNEESTLKTEKKSSVKKTDSEELSVCKYFSESSAVADVEGKAFFDSFASSSLPEISNSIQSPPTVVDDPFSASIRASESDRRHDAWIPSEETLAALKACSLVPVGTYFPQRDQLTMLGIVLEEDLIDPVRQLMSFHMGDESTSRRVTLTVDNVTQDVTGLKELLDSSCYRAAVNLTGRLLVLLGQGVGKAGQPTKITPQIIQIWFVRIALLIKLRQFAIAEVEAAPFGDCDKPDLYYEYYPELYGARKGSMIPFSFRVTLAELQLHLGNFAIALDKLHSILSTIETILSNLDSGLSEDGNVLEMTPENREASISLWQQRKTKVLFSILNCLLAQKDYPSAINVVHLILDRNKSQKSQLWSLLGRIFLQLGDVNGAQEQFNNALKTSPGNPSDKVDDLINSGLIAIAQNEFERGFQKFKEASELDPSNPLMINNMAVCLLYIGRLREALEILEKKINEKPDRFLHEGILFNVCTLYELESSRSSERKQTMLNMVGSTVGDGFNVTCLKLPMPT